MLAVARPLPTRHGPARQAAPTTRLVRTATGLEWRRAPSAAVYRRRRAAAAMVVAGLVVAVMAAAFGVASLLAAAPRSAAHTPGVASVVDGSRAVVVGPGDTVWGIARAIGTGGDVRATVDRIVAANGGSASLRAGQRLVLPN